ncbi:uncharacterized protein BT62DRAFT_1009871 [Guyanagaster necrorhizus]|uniref:Uncharacterized protein n=1 Tax=Guyanagaster necrorhizus TaxID=856835 RepID=A0A9P7VMX6_9AGAR|nr:uncharacterized protein BT62DRAFT_1009871 [Guyanagaster necrorhizus MCA 3950]KAG7442871.1 hypothetical protein BT62DRAFT_1009871 [Guyanagaster necrorhizus MCA 3950]
MPIDTQAVFTAEALLSIAWGSSGGFYIPSDVFIDSEPCNDDIFRSTFHGQHPENDQKPGRQLSQEELSVLLKELVGQMLWIKVKGNLDERNDRSQILKLGLCTSESNLPRFSFTSVGIAFGRKHLWIPTIRLEQRAGFVISPEGFPLNAGLMEMPFQCRAICGHFHQGQQRQCKSLEYRTRNPGQQISQITFERSASNWRQTCREGAAGYVWIIPLFRYDTCA